MGVFWKWLSCLCFLCGVRWCYDVVNILWRYRNCYNKDLILLIGNNSDIGLFPKLNSCGYDVVIILWWCKVQEELCCGSLLWISCCQMHRCYWICRCLYVVIDKLIKLQAFGQCWKVWIVVMLTFIMLLSLLRCQVVAVCIIA